ncbi:preprotein translocase subunit SecA [Acinetobacter qingfengensis]|uniref:Preprotein translocase subunit SecA n=1 Tax=Acinetobacter qingfengensis TaxID=1262585 RepID=A0A1E7RC79_9GAMM|nr:hypothetical protein [Acinetobacter qingfengensis]KAA8735083.1 preprotein translocase subunit SecA [Acinetobacter qingfengensis]OEY97000.1 preprotein translocase subunit SecA [Acinetobacter qingfengensis]
MQNPKPSHPLLKNIDHTTWQWKVFLIYDALMMLLIVCNLLTLLVQAFILSGFGAWITELLHLSTFRSHYIQVWYPIVNTIDFYFICYLIAELAARWLFSIIANHHRRWWFFPFIHWYEVLAIIPMFRFLRLARAGIIAYRLHELGYQVVPGKIIRQVKFYYDVVMEELTDRIVLTVIKGVENELDTSTTHHQRIHAIIDHHRQPFAQALAEILQLSVAQTLAKQQQLISNDIGQIVNQAIIDTPELKQLLSVMPIIGHKLEQQIQSIGQRIGENITTGIVDRFSRQPNPASTANPLLTEISDQISQTPLDTAQIDQLIESIVRESFIGIREQVKIKQWQQKLDKNTDSISNSV